MPPYVPVRISGPLHPAQIRKNDERGAAYVPARCASADWTHPARVDRLQRIDFRLSSHYQRSTWA